MGVEDIEEAGDEVLIYTKPDDLSRIRDDLSEKFQIVSSELIRNPIVTIQIDEKDAQKIVVLVEKLEQLDDVQRVYVNFDFPSTIIQTA